MKKIDITVPVYFMLVGERENQRRMSEYLVFERNCEISIGDCKHEIGRDFVALCDEYYSSLGITPECSEISLSLSTVKPKRKNILEMTVVKDGFIISEKLEDSFGFVQENIHQLLFEQGYQRVYLSATFTKSKKTNEKEPKTTEDSESLIQDDERLLANTKR
jgi:hypothetical protein